MDLTQLRSMYGVYTDELQERAAWRKRVKASKKQSSQEKPPVRKSRSDAMSHFPFVDDGYAGDESKGADAQEAPKSRIFSMGEPAMKRLVGRIYEEMRQGKTGVRMSDMPEAFERLGIPMSQSLKDTLLKTRKDPRIGDYLESHYKETHVNESLFHSTVERFVKSLKKGENPELAFLSDNKRKQRKERAGSIGSSSQYHSGTDDDSKNNYNMGTKRRGGASNRTNAALAHGECKGAAASDEYEEDSGTDGTGGVNFKIYKEKKKPATLADKERMYHAHLRKVPSHSGSQIRRDKERYKNMQNNNRDAAMQSIAKNRVEVLLSRSEAAERAGFYPPGTMGGDPNPLRGEHSRPLRTRTTTTGAKKGSTSAASLKKKYDAYGNLKSGLSALEIADSFLKGNVGRSIAAHPARHDTGDEYNEDDNESYREPAGVGGDERRNEEQAHYISIEQKGAVDRLAEPARPAWEPNSWRGGDDSASGDKQQQQRNRGEDIDGNFLSEQAQAALKASLILGIPPPVPVEIIDEEQGQGRKKNGKKMSQGGDEGDGNEEETQQDKYTSKGPPGWKSTKGGWVADFGAAHTHAMYTGERSESNMKRSARLSAGVLSRRSYDSKEYQAGSATAGTGTVGTNASIYTSSGLTRSRSTSRERTRTGGSNNNRTSSGSSPPRYARPTSASTNGALDTEYLKSRLESRDLPHQEFLFPGVPKAGARKEDDFDDFDDVGISDAMLLNMSKDLNSTKGLSSSRERSSAKYGIGSSKSNKSLGVSDAPISEHFSTTTKTAVGVADETGSGTGGGLVSQRALERVQRDAISEDLEARVQRAIAQAAANARSSSSSSSSATSGATADRVSATGDGRSEMTLDDNMEFEQYMTQSHENDMAEEAVTAVNDSAEGEAAVAAALAAASSSRANVMVEDVDEEDNDDSDDALLESLQQSVSLSSAASASNKSNSRSDAAAVLDTFNNLFNKDESI